MAQDQDEKGSIWASRTSPDSASFRSFVPRRARAGTLPSRLPSRINTESIEDPSLHHGSLALISPDGNDIVYDSIPSSSRSAVGQQPGMASLPGSSVNTAPSSASSSGFASGGEKRKSPPLAPIPEPSSLMSSASRTDLSTSGSALSGSPISSLAAPPSNGRARSGSLNSLAMRAQYPYNPFVSSIWGPGSHTPLQAASAAGGPIPIGSGSSASTTPAAVDLTDPMSVFGNDLGKSANPLRMRSYTLDGAAAGAGADWSIPKPSPSHHQPASLQFAQRARAQTFAPPTGSNLGSMGLGGGGAGLPSQHIALNRIGKQHQLLTERMPDSHIVGDLSSTPTPAICISNVPAQSTPLSLHSLFGSFGKIESARVVPSRKCAYVVFASTIQAIEAQATANGVELYADNGPNSVTFAHIVGSGENAGFNTATMPIPTTNLHSTISGQSGASTTDNGGRLGSITRQLSPENRNHQQFSQGAVALPVTSSPAPVSVAYILQTLNADRNEINEGIDHLRRASSLKFDEPIGALPELLAADGGSTEKVYNAAVLRDLRRRLETMLVKEVEEVALDMQKELPTLASDYIGNTTVQVVFSRSSSEIRDMMLRRLKNVFAATGTHKNGTWAVQKMIDLAQGPRQYSIIERAIRPHLVALLLDQFGNYVVQGCLKFGAPYNDFVYSGIASSLAKVAPNRFGARAVRAVLESEHTTVSNQRIVATAIVQQIATLATNPNGCLLVSWLLDSFERLDSDMHLRTHALVAAQLIPQHLVSMCTSKLGSGIVLKLAGSMSNSSQRVFDALLEPLTDRLPNILVEVLEDPSGQGATCIYRLMTTVFPVQSLERQVTVNKVRMCLLRPGAHIPNHKRLLEEVGLSMLHQEPASTPGSSSAPTETPPHSSSPHGNSPHAHGNGSHSNAAAHGLHGSGAHGSGAHGSGAHGNGVHGNGVHGNGAHGNGAHGNGSHGSGSHNNGTHGNVAYSNGSHPNGNISSSSSNSVTPQPISTNEEIPTIYGDSNKHVVDSMAQLGISTDNHA